MYFNKKYNSSRCLFQGQLQSVHVSDDTQLRHLFAYVSANNLVHKITNQKKFRSSYQEVVEKRHSEICSLSLVNELFDDNLNKLITDGIKSTLHYRSSLKEPEKSYLLE